MNFCTCMVRLGGDMLNVVPRGEFNPVSWPEIEVLRALHGQDSIIDVKVIAEVNQTAKAEKERLRVIYGPAVVEDVFPGKNPQMELKMPGAKLPDQGVTWKSPIDIDPADRGHIEPAVLKAAKPERVATKPSSPFN